VNIAAKMLQRNILVDCAQEGRMTIAIRPLFHIQKGLRVVRF
jgi:hypothetical protein